MGIFGAANRWGGGWAKRRNLVQLYLNTLPKEDPKTI